jgi:hypothetical protein
VDSEDEVVRRSEQRLLEARRDAAGVDGRDRLLLEPLRRGESAAAVASRQEPGDLVAA